MRPSLYIRLTSLLAVGAAAVALSACGGGSSTAADLSTGGGVGEGAGAKAVEGNPVEGGSIVYGTDREPTCLDPHNLGDMPQTYVARQFLDSLVSMQPNGDVVPWLADSWTISDDGLQYTFKLKKGVKFTDGTPFDAEAVKANFEQTLDPETESSTNLVYLLPIYKGIDVLDKYTVRVNLKRPYSPFLDVLGQAFFGMESPQAMARGIKANCVSPVGTGPFIVKKWVKGQQIDLVRNDDYNSPPADSNNQGPAYLEAITWRFLPDSSVRWSALESGEAQAIFNIPPEDFGAAQADPNIELQQFTHAGIGHYIVLDNSEPPFDDLKVRQAFNLAANTPAAVESAYQGAYPAATSAISSGTPFYTDKFANLYPYDVEKAKKLLDEAGWKEGANGVREKDGKPLTVKFIYGSGPGETPPAELTLYQNVQAAVKEAGFDVKLVPMPQAPFYEAANVPADFDAEPTYWNCPTPMCMYIVASTETYDQPFANMSKIKNPELDKTLLAAAAADPEDRATQQKLYEKAQQIIAENAYWVPMYPEQTLLGVSKKLKGVWIEPSEGEPVFSDAWLEG
ncbi:MAG TPA: ABC transporter substrate-binding protein [Solirubrobacterales bacterium]|nr:ABC transporter substrate-binding protein [Solirubrobacterales bacterium]